MRKVRYDKIGKRCNLCGKTKSLENFNKNKGTKDGLQYYCRDCTKAADKRRNANPIRQEEARARALAHYKNNRIAKLKSSLARQLELKLHACAYLGGKCQKCGEKHPAALQFHHRNPEEKSFNVSSKTLSATKQFPWEIIQQELDKCDLLCANCHAKHHSRWTKEMIDSYANYSR